MKTTENKNSILVHLVPIMLAFFAMGFVDLAGIATNYIKEDFALSDTVANLFTSMVFFWFLVGSVPTGMLMNKIGRRKTVLWSLIVTLAAVALPLLGYNLTVMASSFTLLGIGNTMMQVSLNPLLSNIVSKKRLSSAVTFGQFVKAAASFSAPLIAGWGALYFDNWRLLYAVFLVEGIIAFIALKQDKIKEDEVTGKVSSFKDNFRLLGNKLIFLSFVAILCHVGIDVGTNVTVPKVLMEKLSFDLSAAGYAASVYFLFRTFGSLFGAYVLANYSTRKFFMASSVMIAAGLLGLIIFSSLNLLYASIGLIGFGNANIFSMVFSQVILSKPEKKNEISGLMIMGICGGAVFPILMGLAADFAGSQSGAVTVMGVCALYLLYMISKIKDSQ